MGISSGSRVSALIDLCDYQPLTAEQRRAAALVVCGNDKGKTRAEQVDDARYLLGALGLLPGQQDDLDATKPEASGKA